MIVSNIVTINGKEFERKASDGGFYITRAGVMYSEAVDPIGSGREYTETETPIETETAEDETAARLDAVEAEAAKNAANIDYIAMMADIDLEV